GKRFNAEFTENPEGAEKRRCYANVGEARDDDDCECVGGGWRRARAGNADARAGTPSDGDAAGETGISADGKSAGKCEGRADHARTGAEDRQRIESHLAASGGGDSCRQGTTATGGPLSESNRGLHWRGNPRGIGRRRAAGL